MAKDATKGMTLQEASVGVLLMEAKRKSDERHAAMVNIVGLLDAVLELIDSNELEKIKDLRGMIESAVRKS